VSFDAFHFDQSIGNHTRIPGHDGGVHQGKPSFNRKKRRPYRYCNTHRVCTFRINHIFFFGITIEAFQIMGGIIFFRSGMHMLDAKVGRTRTTVKEQEEFITAHEIAYTPVGVPLITGPGAITGVMLLSAQTNSPYSFGTLIISILIVMISLLIIFIGGEKLSRKIGITGMRIIQRIMGLMLMVIAVQFVINGITTVFNKI